MASVFPDDKCLHVIADDGSFGSPVTAFSSFFTSASIQNNKYSLVAILGCQSTGKSTLLNLLFGTKFGTMDAAKGRQQTTRGVWIEASNKIEGVVVLDMEGTDRFGV